MPKTKKFIDRKKAVTFNLVHRSQRDPLAADESAPQRVLVPVNAAVPPRKEKEPELTPEQRIEEQRKYGVYFDDDYNYLQHLKDTKEVTLVLQPKATHKRKEKCQPSADEDEPVIPVAEKLNLPSSVFASAVEEDVGLLNKAATQGLCLDLDPEVVAALDEDFDFEDPENELEDNFIELAMAEGGDGSDGEEYEDDDSMANDSDQAFASDLDSDDDSNPQETRRMPVWEREREREQDDTRSRFSQYSMSSSVIRRNQGLTLLDDRFEKMFAEYDDTELGALECEDIEGFMPESHDMLLKAAEEFEESRRRQQLDKEREIARIQRLQEIEEESEEELETIEVPREEKWDCETILSTYSNLYNHPKIIEEPKKPGKIRINPKTGIPKDVFGDNKLTMKSLAKFNALQDTGDDDDDAETNAETVLSTLSVLSLRPKDEAPEERKERKRLLKEYRKERRVEKKANKEAFKEEKKRQEKVMLNNKNNVQGNRIL
ncbi:protein LTV1 homolog isoform X2 [Cydia strobilella]|uniref:protein LTV1 homolog isoform X2 n=1 Tax=Cydia strobilella TaxID=1100964 RepID=UPI0030042EBB